MRKYFKIIPVIFLIVVFLFVVQNQEKNVSTTSTYNIQKIKTLENTIENETISNIIKESSVQIHKGPGRQPQKIAYITIDDGPTKYTTQILDILNDHNIKATFFMMNNNMKRYEDVVKKISEEGHSIGFHSVTHDIKQIYKTPQATVEEFDACRDTLYDFTGEISKLIRLPYGSKPYMPQKSYDALVNSGYLIWDWNLDTKDWSSTTDQIVSNILYEGRDNKEIVLLMHEKPQTIDALESTIKILKERGYTILPISQYSEPKNYWERNLIK